MPIVFPIRVFSHDKQWACTLSSAQEAADILEQAHALGWHHTAKRPDHTVHCSGEYLIPNTEQNSYTIRDDNGNVVFPEDLGVRKTFRGHAIWNTRKRTPKARKKAKSVRNVPCGNRYLRDWVSAVEQYREAGIRRMPTKDFFYEDPWDESIPFQAGERSWKNHRKSQYKN